MGYGNPPPTTHVAEIKIFLIVFLLHNQGKAKIPDRVQIINFVK